MQLLRFALWNFHTLAESLPISSSGHMTLLIRFIKRLYPSALAGKEEFSEEEEHLMHLPTLGILTIFLCTYIPTWTGLSLLKAILKWAFPLCLANGITGILYLLLKREKRTLFPLHKGFLITSFTLLLLTLLPSGKATMLSVPQACLIGVAQGCTLLPGISRLAFTFTVGVALGLQPSLSMLFSLGSEWILIVCALTKIFASSLLKPVKGISLQKTLDAFSSLQVFIFAYTCYQSYYALVYATGLCIAQKTLPFSLYMVIPTLLTIFLDKTLLVTSFFAPKGRL